MEGERIRTFNARRGRTRDAMRERLADHAELLVPGGPLDPAAVFGRTAPLVLEIGAGQGHAALAYAAGHPERDLIATDVYTPGVSRLVAGLVERGLSNVRAHEGDALLVLDRLPPSSLAAVHVFFPDPWPKVRHHKRRLIRGDVVELLVDRLAVGGEVLVATDDAAYAQQASVVLADQPDLVGGVAPRPAWRPSDGYEARAIANRSTIHELRFERAR